MVVARCAWELQALSAFRAWMVTSDGQRAIPGGPEKNKAAFFSGVLRLAETVNFQP